MNNYFSSNLKKLAQIHTQKQIALNTSASQASITNYINGTNEPSLSFVMQLKNAYNINIDDFLYKEISPDADTSVNKQQFSRFIGNYIFYYYDTSRYKGSNNIYTKNDLNYGMISVVYGDKTSQYPKAYAQFLLNRKESEELLDDLNNKTEAEIVGYYNKLEDKYVGNINPNNTHIFLTLKNTAKNDECFIILNNPPSSKSYIGGIATVNSVSRGREHMPCIQYSIMSRYVLKITDGEIYSLLTLNTPEINTDIDVEHLIKLFKTLYINSDETSLNLNEYQKKRIIEESFKNALEELIENNVFKFAKISDMEDDKYYRIIKEEMYNE